MKYAADLKNSVDDDTARIVWCSGGADSTALALRLQKLHPDVAWRFICTPTGNELPELLDHWDLMSEILGKPLERIEHPLGLKGLIEAQNMLPSHHSRWCTRMLKILPALRFLAENAPSVAYVGLRADEPEREGLFGSKAPQVYPMREWGWTRADVEQYLDRQGIRVPRRTDCAWCYDQALADWWELWHNYPAIFEQGVEIEERRGHTFRSPNRDTWPVSLKDLRAKFEGGSVPRGTVINRDLFSTEPQRCRACLL